MIVAPLAAVPALLAMHAPDGLFSMPVNVIFGIVVAALLARACASLSRSHDHRLVPLMGIIAAFIFAGQMVNFPIASGTTGHLLGGTLAAILLGPWAGTVVMGAVIVFQALLGDGGITVLGPNIFNMGVVGTCMAYFIYRGVVGQAFDQRARIVAASFFAAWVSVPLASIFTSLQLSVSGTASLSRALPAMVLTHMAIGVGEALITAGVVAFIVKTRPELLYGRPTQTGRPVGRLTIAFGLIASLCVATCLALLPKLWDYPDGLEYVGLQKGFLLEPPLRADGGAYVEFPAYPLGVRLALVDGQVTATHRYEQQATQIAPGDVIQGIESTATPDLSAVAAALKFDVDRGIFDLHAGDPLCVAVQRAGQELELAIATSAGPSAGSTPPVVALLPDYTVPGVAGLVSTSLAGAIGTVVMFVVAFAVARVLVRPLPGLAAESGTRAQE